MARSSKQWLRRHVTDAYVRRAKAQGYRSRAAFKLAQIDARERLFRPGAVVVDLGAAPGGWSQVAAERVRPGGRVIAVDFLALAPIVGVTVLQGDFRKAPLLEALGARKADVVLADLSPNLSGIADVDQARAAELIRSALEFCGRALKPDGIFVVKLFQGTEFAAILAQLKRRFRRVATVKPPASRGESNETYAVSRGLLGAGDCA
jgi:23S rRNA (uridine2552-2'-O)-methyltransferase